MWARLRLTPKCSMRPSASVMWKLVCPWWQALRQRCCQLHGQVIFPQVLTSEASSILLGVLLCKVSTLAWRKHSQDCHLLFHWPVRRHQQDASARTEGEGMSWRTLETVLAWMWNLYIRLLLLDTWSQVGGTLWDGCGTLRKWIFLLTEVLHWRGGLAELPLLVLCFLCVEEKQSVHSGPATSGFCPPTSPLLLCLPAMVDCIHLEL